MFDSLSEKLHKKLKSTDKKTMIIAGAIGAALAVSGCIGAYYTPYLTVNSIKNAAENRNADALSQSINFPELKTNIKASIKDQVLKQIAEDSTKSPQATSELVEKAINPVVDKLVTPEGIERIMFDKIPEAKIDLTQLDKDLAKSNITMGYESFDRFVVHITDKVNRSKNVSLILKRDGLAWKLSAIDISKV
ncbi:DUF2939 domain-containing protein [Chamaesiphon sp. OTE_20_metabat_361]|uniref:DUF2939 domain-containing protein n=1 Tax=Chamaesiphon sp. OTE_20_metabat_361 TaxID=2964689 RepID=UPI00286A5A66|nr:DUF2939 domain-containing protein [Chamaesiphon sp. OTE_20_metabat_361]